MFEFKTFVFYFLSIILILAAFRVITARNPVHAVLFLVLAFFTASGVWILLEAEFLAITLVLVYVGAVMVLFLFVVMMLDINIDRLRQGFWNYLPLGLMLALLLILEIGVVLISRYSKGFDLVSTPKIAGASNVKDLAGLLYTQYYYPFELASIILLIAIIAAVVIAYRGSRAGKRTNPAKQVAVKAKDRIQVVQMPAEKQD